MAINNPYIPGDPYSYDLKWLVAKVKEILLQLGTLDETITKKIFEAFLDHSIVQFKTVANMLAADIKDGSIVLTLGYHEAGDQGGMFYLIKDFNPGQCSLEYFLTMDNNKQIAIPVIVTPYVTPEMFGAYGDGVNDDSDPFQKALDLCDVILLPEKSEYYVTQSLEMKDEQTIKGPGTILDHFTPETGSTVPTGILDATDKKNIVIDGIKIKGTGAGGTGVLVNYKETISFNECENITVKNCLITDVNSFAAVRVNGCEKANIVHNEIERYSYAGISNAQGSDDVLIDGNRIIDCLNADSANVYPITLHSYEITPYSGMKHGHNIICTNNYIYDSSPKWSAIDAHGGYNVVVANNICENTLGGIAVFTDPARFFYAEDVTIDSNLIKIGTVGTARNVNAQGITVSGKNFTVSNNIVENAGALSTDRAGGIRIFEMENAFVHHNVFKNSYCHFAYFGGNTKNVWLENNIFDTVNLTSFSESGIGILFQNGYYGDVQIRKNKFDGVPDTKRFVFAPNNALSGNDFVAHIRFYENDFDNMEFNDLTRFGNFNLNYCVPQFQTAAPAGRQGRKGDIVYNLNPASGQPVGWICTASFTGNNYSTWVALPAL